MKHSPSLEDRSPRGGAEGWFPRGQQQSCSLCLLVSPRTGRFLGEASAWAGGETKARSVHKKSKACRKLKQGGRGMLKEVQGGMDVAETKERSTAGEPTWQEPGTKK